MRTLAPRLATGLLCQALALLIAGCGGGGGGSTPAPPPPPPPPPDITAPSIPQSLAASGQTTTSISLTWNASTDAGTGVAGYRVYRDGSATPIANVTTTAYTDTGLGVSSTHDYAVRAFDRATPANESALSATASATTLATPPPTGLNVRPSNTTCLAGAAPTQSLGVQRVFPNLPSILAAHRHAAGARQRCALVRGAEDRHGARVRQHGERVHLARVHRHFFAAEFRSRQSQRRARPARHGLPSQLSDRSARVSLLHRHATPSLGLVDRVVRIPHTDGGATLSPRHRAGAVQRR